MEENKTVLKIALTGRIDSANALQVEKDIRAQLDGKDAMPIELDASGLEYISSSGLRVILRLRKQYPDITITGVSPEVYEILEMTGFSRRFRRYGFLPLSHFWGLPAFCIIIDQKISASRSIHKAGRTHAVR